MHKVSTGGGKKSFSMVSLDDNYIIPGYLQINYQHILERIQAYGTFLKMLRENKFQNKQCLSSASVWLTFQFVLIWEMKFNYRKKDCMLQIKGNVLMDPGVSTDGETGPESS